MIGNWIDLIIIFYLAVHFIDGVKRGFYSILVNMGSFIISLFFAYFTYSLTAQFFCINFGLEIVYGNIIGFFLNMFIVKFLILVVSRIKLPASLFIINKSIKRRVASGFVSLLYSTIVVFLLVSITFAFSLPSYFRNELYSSTFGNFVAKDPIKINNGLKNIFGDAISVTMDKFDFLTVETGDNERKVLNFTVSNPVIDENAEAQMLELINNERISRNLNPLVIDEKARETARKHGIDMFKNGYFSHINLEGESPSERMKKGEVEFLISGENIALSENVQLAHNGLMRSQGHRENILRKIFFRVGIGVLDGGERGIIFVQNFAD